ncbi:PH domain-containing protein [Kribbella sp. NPDC051718]|uniref:PH domain-containing protein n=1 Tax=Kribbella sp. NPDC051718 TaxID=3155168 RepID=UPI0034315C41
MAFRAIGNGAILAVCVVVLAEMCLLAVYDEFSSIPDEVAVIVSVVVGLLILWRFARVGVAVTPTGLKLLNLGRDELVPWTAIADIRLDEGEASLGATAIPYVELADPPSPEEPGILLTCLSGYTFRGRNRRVTRQTTKLRQHWLDHQPGTPR